MLGPPTVSGIVRKKERKKYFTDYILVDWSLTKFFIDENLISTWTSSCFIYFLSSFLHSSLPGSHKERIVRHLGSDDSYRPFFVWEKLQKCKKAFVIIGIYQEMSLRKVAYVFFVLLLNVPN